MSIKSDKWIRKMAETKDMISPFERNQVRESNNNKIISYGTSSYGYDVRCSSKFKVFTNIHSATVDPKNKQTYDVENFISIEKLLDSKINFEYP